MKCTVSKGHAANAILGCKKAKDGYLIKFAFLWKAPSEIIVAAATPMHWQVFSSIQAIYSMRPEDACMSQYSAHWGGQTWFFIFPVG